MEIQRAFIILCFVLSVVLFLGVTKAVSSNLVANADSSVANGGSIVISDLGIIEPGSVRAAETHSPSKQQSSVPSTQTTSSTGFGQISEAYVHPFRLQPHTSYDYPPFVIPSPFRTPAMTFPTFSSISSYYSQLKAASAHCYSAICKHPENYLNQYANWPCKEHPESCSKDSVLIMQEEKYLVGHLDVIENGIAFRQYDCGWPADHSKSVPNGGSAGGHFSGTLAYLPVPQCMSFQHFIDGLLPKLVQMRDIIANDKSVYYAVDTSFDDKLPRMILERLGIPSDHIISTYSLPWKDDRLHADKLILSCKVPPLHPKLWQEAQEMLRLPWLDPSWKQQRHIVLLFSRSRGTRNSGRLIVNEREIIDAITPVLSAKGYELVVFNPSEYPDLDSLFDFLANVDMVIGPHGGAFYNILFMRRGVTVVECMPNDRYFLSTNKAVHLIIYLQSMLLGDHYFNVLGASQGNDNMIIDPSVVLSIINEKL